jgi:hypothetical protein
MQVASSAFFDEVCQAFAVAPVSQGEAGLEPRRY